MPDENFPSDWYFDDHTLHCFLRTYMRLQNEYIEEFYTTDKRYVYTYATLERNSCRYSLNHIFFDSYEACLQALKGNKNDEIVKMKITRHRVYSAPISSFEAQEQESVIFDKQLRPMDIWTTWDAEGEQQLLCPSWGFYDMWVAIPTPFEKGDIVTDVEAYDGYTQARVPLVLDDMPRRQKSSDGWVDMLAGCHRLTGSGEGREEYDSEYLNLEYYREEVRRN